MTNQELQKLLEEHKDKLFKLCVYSKIDEQSLSTMLYPYPYELLEEYIIDKDIIDDKTFMLNNYPLSDISLCDIGYSDKVVVLDIISEYPF